MTPKEAEAFRVEVISVIAIEAARQSKVHATTLVLVYDRFRTHLTHLRGAPGLDSNEIRETIARLMKEV